MATWTKDDPCSYCGRIMGKKLQCVACKTVGCQVCLGGTARGVCNLCKKLAERRPV